MRAKGGRQNALLLTPEVQRLIDGLLGAAHPALTLLLAF